jgi:hypothetical protein
MTERPNPVPPSETGEKDSDDQKREELCAQISALLDSLLKHGPIFEEATTVSEQKES